MLTAAQVETFHRDGFVIVPALYDAVAVRNISAWSDELCAWPEVLGRHLVYYEDGLIDGAGRIVSRIENFCPYHEGLNGLTREGAMIDIVTQLFDEPAILFKEKINMKMPGGDGFKPHQDAQAGWKRYADVHITAMLGIDSVTVENGCLDMAGDGTAKASSATNGAPLSPMAPRA